VKPAQVRMARAALNWSLQQLADASGVHRNTISNFETGRYAGEAEKIAAMQRALEAAGVEFTNGGEPGVRMKMANLTETNIALLQQLIDLPASKRITMGAPPAAFRELIAAGYAAAVSLNLSDLLTEITEEGRRALTAANSGELGVKLRKTTYWLHVEQGSNRLLFRRDDAPVPPGKWATQKPMHTLPKAARLNDEGWYIWEEPTPEEREMAHRWYP
jgi:transcriptional regulator with XRE-family HTH domain